MPKTNHPEATLRKNNKRRAEKVRDAVEVKDGAANARKPQTRSAGVAPMSSKNPTVVK